MRGFGFLFVISMLRLNRPSRLDNAAEFVGNCVLIVILSLLAMEWFMNKEAVESKIVVINNIYAVCILIFMPELTLKTRI